MQRITVETSDAGRRLDRVVAARTGETRSQVIKWFHDGLVKVAGERLPASQAAKPGQVLEIDLPVPSSAKQPVPNLKILYEDQDLLVVDKPPGLAVHLSESGRPQPTVAAFAAAHGVADDDSDRPGIVHRLDKDTSGAMAIAKDPHAKEYLQKLFAKREVDKTYWALVRGSLENEHAIIRLPLGRNRKSPTKRAVVPGGRDAITEYRVLSEYPHATLVEVQLQTGRTHQIRVHFAHMGHPVVGDKLYGGGQVQPMAPRQFLHAARLAFLGPSGQHVDVESPLPADLSHYLSQL